MFLDLLSSRFPFFAMDSSSALHLSTNHPRPSSLWDSPVEVATGRLKKHIRADRPRSHRFPWLPKFPKLRRRTTTKPEGTFQADLKSLIYEDPVCQQLSTTESQTAPKTTTTFPTQRFLADTAYPRLRPSDPAWKDILSVLPKPLPTDITAAGSKLKIEPKLKPGTPSAQRHPPQPGLRPADHELPLLVEINGIRTNKRRAEDTEVDLVAAILDSNDTNLPSSVYLPRRGIQPDTHITFKDLWTEPSMFGTLPTAGRIARMMSNFFTAFTELGDRIRRLLYHESYDVVESRTFINSKSKGTDGNETIDIAIAKKRIKLSSKEHSIEWLDRDGLNDLLGAYEHLRECLYNVWDCIATHPSREEMNKLLRPLLPVLADNPDDLNRLRAGEEGVDLARLFQLLGRRAISSLSCIYEIGSFIKMSKEHHKVPVSFQYSPNTDDALTFTRVKNFLSSPYLLDVFSSILEVSGLYPGFPLPSDFIDNVLLDMHAIENNLVLPSYVISDDYQQRMRREFPPPVRTSVDHIDFDIPGKYPGIADEDVESEIQRPTTPSGPSLPPSPSPSCSPHIESTPMQHIAKADAGKTAHVRAELLASKISQITSAEYRASFYNESAAHRAIEKTYITDFEPKQPLRANDLGTISSILTNRKKKTSAGTPKRLAIRRAPKTVRFTESTVSPRQRTHLGLDLPKLIHPGKEKSDMPSHVSDIILTQKSLESEAALKQHDKQSSPLIKPRTHKSDSIFPYASTYLPRRYKKEKVDPELAIQRILSLPSIKSLAISDDTKAGIALKKEQAALKAAEEARKLAEEKARREIEERLARTGGLRTPEQPLVSPIGSEWLQKAEATLRAGASTTLATTGEGVDLRRHDFCKVVPPTEWLNDEIVNGSLHWLDQSINAAAGIADVKKKTRKCLAMSSFFFKRLQEQGVSRTQRTLRRYGVEKRNLLDVDTILLPVCEHSHWTLLVVRPSKKTIAHMDSLNPRGSQPYISLVRAWLKDLLEDKFVEDEWNIVRHEAPMQTNGYDCGVHTITNGICVALGLNPIDSYSSKDMPLQRIRLACMLLNGGFKGDFNLRVY